MLVMGVAEVPVAVALGAMVLGERLPAGTFLGAACVLVSLIGALFTKVSPRIVSIVLTAEIGMAG